jgi:hypothetical protein
MGFGSERKVLARFNLSFVPLAQGRYQIPFPAPYFIPPFMACLLALHQSGKVN